MDKVAADLTRILGPERLLWEREHLATYGFDGTAALYAEAGCVALPETTAEVTQVVRYAGQNKIPVVTRGSGTGLSGGSVPVRGCIVLCLVQMDRVLELDQKNLTIHVESGVVTQKSGRARRCRRAPLSARSGFDEDFNDRGQRSGELRRFARA